MTILITGHAGFLGKHIGSGLTSDGVAWIGLDRMRSASAREQIVCDIRSLPAAIDQLSELEMIIHLASPVGVVETGADHAATYDAIVSGARVIIALALRTSAKLLYFSSSEVFGEVLGTIDHSTPVAPISGYGRGKLAAEELITELVGSAVIVRPFNVYGPGQRAGFLIPNIIRQLESDGTMRLVDGGHPVRQFTYVGDVVEAVRRIRRDWPPSPQTLHLAGPEAATIAHVVEIAGLITGRSINISAVAPRDLGRDPQAEIRNRTVVPDWIGDWAPPTTIEAGLRLTFATAHQDSSRPKATEQ